MCAVIRYVLFAATSYDTFYNTAAIASAYAATVTGWFDGTTGTWDVNANAITLSGGDVTTLMTVSSCQCGGCGSGSFGCSRVVVVVHICTPVLVQVVVLLLVTAALASNMVCVCVCMCVCVCVCVSVCLHARLGFDRNPDEPTS